jgi:hypothetical protein
MPCRLMIRRIEPGSRPAFSAARVDLLVAGAQLVSAQHSKRRQHAEDVDFFPELRDTNPAINPVIDRLQAEHRRISDDLDAVEAAAKKNALANNESPEAQEGGGGLSPDPQRESARAPRLRRAQRRSNGLAGPRAARTLSSDEWPHDDHEFMLLIERGQWRQVGTRGKSPSFSTPIFCADHGRTVAPSWPGRHTPAPEIGVGLPDEIGVGLSPPKRSRSRRRVALGAVCSR